MKEISKEFIEIGGKEYTLFLNRKGLVAWEKYAKEENNKVAEIEQKFLETTTGKNAEIKEDTNPFEDIEEPNPNENDELISSSYRKLYWIMLYENHKLSITEVNKLYDEAKEEYGEGQLISLGVQMIQDINSDKVSGEQLKKLAALKPSKK